MIAFRNLRLGLLAVPVVFTSACAMQSEPESAATAPAGVVTASAQATLQDAAGNHKGQVSVRQQGNDLVIEVVARDLTPGLHGAHIHMRGQCTPPDFASAGGHWNPAAAQHGLENPHGAHKGDLPNLQVEADGSGTLSFTVTGAQLEGPHALLDADGAAFVIHAAADDMKTDPSGNSGGRVACGTFAKG